MAIRSDLPDAKDVPIPDDVRPGAYWSSTMVELADIIGPAPTLRLCVELGGTSFVVPGILTKTSDLMRVLGRETAQRLTDHYAGENLYVPKADTAILHARILSLMGPVARGEMSINDVGLILNVKRTYVSKLMNDGAAGTRLPPPAGRRARQIELFTDRETHRDRVRDTVRRTA